MRFTYFYTLKYLVIHTRDILHNYYSRVAVAKFFIRLHRIYECVMYSKLKSFKVNAVQFKNINQ